MGGIPKHIPSRLPLAGTVCDRAAGALGEGTQEGRFKRCLREVQAFRATLEYERDATWRSIARLGSRTVLISCKYSNI